MKARQIAAAIALLLLTVAFARAEDKADRGEWIQLFNGKNLDGWTMKIAGYELGENYNNTFRVEDGLLKVAFDKYDKFDGKFGHLFFNKPFSNYLLRVEYRFVGEQVPGGPGWAWRNSGIMIHGQSPQSMEKNQSFPVSIEVQLLGGRESGQRPTGNLCTPGTNVVMDGKLVRRHCTSSSSKTYRGDQWVTIEVLVRGNKLVKHVIEGQTVMEYTQPQLDENDAQAGKLIKDGNIMLGGGSISLQAESHPVEFRKVELRELKD